MLNFSEGQMSALEADHARQRPIRMCDWWARHADVLGPRDAFSCRQLLDGLTGEIDFAGLVDEVEQFLFCAARVRMPDMGDRQYLLSLDAIVSDAGDRDRLHAIDRIASTVPANG